MKRAATVIGSGPNGLSAAIVLAQAGWDVVVREASLSIGGGIRSAELTLPGFVHDVCSAVHPMAFSSPFFSKLQLQTHGLNWVWSPAALAHPLDDGTAITLERRLDETTRQFLQDSTSYKALFKSLVKKWRTLVQEILRPQPYVPKHPFLLAHFGLGAIQPATRIANNHFRDLRARALWAGVAAHSILKLEAPLSSAFGLIMGASAHAVGWPIPRGGTQNIANALSSVLNSLGGRIVTGSRVGSLDELGGQDATLCDVTPRQLLALARGRLPNGFRRSLERYQYGPGVFKVDWALREPIPWKAKECRRAATIHLGGSLEEIARSECDAWEGRPPHRPFVLLCQPSLFDPSRAPAGHHTAWAYCHVPNGWPDCALPDIEAQVERFAPGFRDCVLATATRNTKQMEESNENLIGGDIAGGAPTFRQFFFRPTWRQYRTPLKGVYLCSSSTPPGASVHGMCGYWAAKWVLADSKKSRF
ncbi:MAG: NAD(P)/FAD-dependent oxidoreductase [Acidobacteriaceae bacterium]|nr:NAD(P)/FAD-dependent oxidoreductase [Acidobacteriaceae bacterium]MBV9779801.1 NAD(P)/FAD-dependent oxidoreductase [Acidobacteriaceae bacterium]